MKYILIACFTLIGFATKAQGKLIPVKWEFEVEKLENDEYLFSATAKIDDKWTVYSQHTGEGGPVRLSFQYNDSSVLVGYTEEKSEAIKEFSDLFEVEVIKFKKEAVFTQKFKAKTSDKNFSGTLTFMCCDGLRCLPPTDVAFDVAL